MKILVAILHHWNPEGSGRHQSLRPDPEPRLAALREQILGLSRLGRCQFHFHLADQAAYAANHAQRHAIDIHVVTDGKNHLIDDLYPNFRNRIQHVAASPNDPLLLGFEVHQHLKRQLEQDYDLYAYFEDDLIIHDPYFFIKIARFVDAHGQNCVLLPQRFELLPIPSFVDKLYVDGPLAKADLDPLRLQSEKSITLNDSFLGEVCFESPSNPHAGCFVLTHSQLQYWASQDWWLDRDCSFISPLESAATLGLVKTFQLYKPTYAHASALEIQHWGAGFLSLMANAKPMMPAEHG